jgi:PleD family two-component response regulator
MMKSRKTHPIVQAAQTAASEINDLLNAIGLRVSLLPHQHGESASEAEMVRLAELVDKASQRVQRLEEYARAEELVASMRPARRAKVSKRHSIRNPGTGSEPACRSALLIADSSAENEAIRECLEHSGYSVVIAESSDDGLRLLESDDHFDHIVCDSTFLSEAGWKFAAELSRAVPASRVYVYHRGRMADSVAEHR